MSLTQCFEEMQSGRTMPSAGKPPICGVSGQCGHKVQLTKTNIGKDAEITQTVAGDALAFFSPLWRLFLSGLRGKQRPKKLCDPHYPIKY